MILNSSAMKEFKTAQTAANAHFVVDIKDIALVSEIYQNCTEI